MEEKSRIKYNVVRIAGQMVAPHAICTDNRLRKGAFLLYMQLYRLVDDYLCYVGSISELAEHWREDVKKTKRMLKRLEDCGYISSEEDGTIKLIPIKDCACFTKA